MHRRTNKLRSIKVRRFVARLFELNEYLASFYGANLSDKICVTELNNIFQTVCLIAGLSKHMCKALIVNTFH